MNTDIHYSQQDASSHQEDGVMGKQARIDEIKSWLDAYRNGWVAYDRDHVHQLREELAALAKAVTP